MADDKVQAAEASYWRKLILRRKGDHSVEVHVVPGYQVQRTNAADAEDKRAVRDIQATRAAMCRR